MVALAGSAVQRAQAAQEMKIQAILVWGTDQPKPPEGKNYKPLDEQITKRLRALKWKNYFEVKRIDFTATTGAPKKIAVSDKCELDVQALGNSKIEVVLYGKGKEAARVKGVLPKNEILVPGGDAPNETAWLLVLKRLD
jgi:hypothetical protein